MASTIEILRTKDALDLWSLLPAAAGVLRTKGALDLWSLLPATAGVEEAAS